MKRAVISSVIMGGALAMGMGMGVGAANAAPTVSHQAASPMHATFNEGACPKDRGSANIKKVVNGVTYQMKFLSGPYPAGTCRPYIWVVV